MNAIASRRRRTFLTGKVLPSLVLEGAQGQPSLFEEDANGSGRP